MGRIGGTVTEGGESARGKQAVNGSGKTHAHVGTQALVDAT